MKRRDLLRVLTSTAGGGMLVSGSALSAMAGQGPVSPELLSPGSAQRERPALTVAHITDVHITAGSDAPARFKKCLSFIVEKYKPDFFLNGGDSIMDASYKGVTREKMLEQWSIWDECIKTIDGYDHYACIGNHDPWWDVPDKEDKMYGKDYVVQRQKLPGRYYSFSRKGWHFIILDGNNENISLDKIQLDWLQKELEQLPTGTPALLMSHFPILGTTPMLVGGGHSDFKALKNLFYQHRDKVKICLSGHNHLSDKTLYDGVYHCCNGAMSGFWWGQGDKESAGPGYYMETPPGFAILKLYADGRVENEYIPHHF
jgi:3',5'-cyclic-AMP phosphodiesterase